MESLTNERRAEIDAIILAGDVIAAMSRIMKACGVGLRAARYLFWGRYRQLRPERNAEFACGDEEYRSGYGSLSLAQARKNYLQFGACEEKMIENVRPPREDELS